MITERKAAENLSAELQRLVDEALRHRHVEWRALLGCTDAREYVEVMRLDKRNLHVKVMGTGRPRFFTISVKADQG